MTGSALASHIAVIAVTLAGGTAAWGAEVTEIIDPYPLADDASGLAFALSLDWGWRSRQGTIRREGTCLAEEAIGGAQLCPQGGQVLLFDELDVDRVTSTLELAAALAVAKRFMVTLTVPFVLRDQVTLGYAAGVDASNTTVDPDSAASLFEVPDGGRERAGVGDVRLALRAAPLSAALDAGAVSWVLGAGLSIPTAGARGVGNDAVGDGVWVLGVDTAVSGRVWRVVEPFVRLDAAFRLPTAEGPFQEFGDTHLTSNPQHALGITLGTDLIPFERPALHSAVRLTVGARLEWVFEGRGYSDLFDALGGSGCDPADLDAPCALTTYDRGDIDPATGRARRMDGVTNLEGHAVVKGWLGLRYEVFETLSLSARASITHETDHFLTYADPGVDLDGQRDVEPVNSDGDNELNPTWSSAVDAPGARFRSADTLIFAIDLGVRGTF